MYTSIRGRVLSSILSVIVSLLLLEALVKKVKLILIYTTIAFTDKSKRYLVFVKRLT